MKKNSSVGTTFIICVPRVLMVLKLVVMPPNRKSFDHFLFLLLAIIHLPHCRSKLF